MFYSTVAKSADERCDRCLGRRSFALTVARTRLYFSRDMIKIVELLWRVPLTSHERKEKGY